MSCPIRTSRIQNKARSSSPPLRSWAMAAMWLLLVVVALGCQPRQPDNTLRIGLPEEPRTLNIWLASDANSRNILRLIYQPLYVEDPETLERVPWLAATLPVYDAEKLSYTLTLRPSRWSDGRDLTSTDVAFTADLIKEFQIPGLASRWAHVERIETPDPATVVFYLKKPLATFLSRTLEISIVPAHQWLPAVEAARLSEKPLAHLLNYDIGEPIGAGPFMLREWRRGDYLYLVRNPHFFGSGLTLAGHALGPYIDGLLVKIYGTTDVAMLALRQGGIDMFWHGIQPGYIEILRRHASTQIYITEKSALYYMGMNTRSAPFDDPVLRQAVALLVDKDFILKRLLQGRGTKMFSIIPPGNQLWYNPDLPRYGDGLSWPERMEAARTLLAQAGYSWDQPPIIEKGAIANGQGLRTPNGELVAPFTILTPPADYDPARALSGTMIQEWLRSMGIPASSRPMEFSALLDRVRNRRDFDAFVLGYGRLPIDPDYLGTFFSSDQDKPRGLNMSGYNNPDFDHLSAQSQSAMDEDRRREIIFRMQQIVMADVPYLPLYLPNQIEAVRTDRFHGWVPMLDGIGNRWSFNVIRPVEQKKTAQNLVPGLTVVQDTRFNPLRKTSAP
jgi:peptide/nickel transport system substrate-binding protein